jgi:quercetin dioxygenase-like cupin family protein
MSTRPKPRSRLDREQGGSSDAQRTRVLADGGIFLGAVVVASSGDGRTEDASPARVGETVTPIFAHELPNVPGQRLTALVVDYAPGGRTGPHHHAGSVFAYILSGAIRSELGGGSPIVYHAGETFFEPPGSVHLMSENASESEPARLLAIFVAEDGATLTTPDR